MSLGERVAGRGAGRKAIASPHPTFIYARQSFFEKLHNENIYFYVYIYICTKRYIPTAVSLIKSYVSSKVYESGFYYRQNCGFFLPYKQYFFSYLFSFSVLLYI